MEQLPIELVRTIRDYVYRCDWRTCKKREASLVASLFNTAQQTVCFEAEEMCEWTLFGLLFINRLPERFHYAPGRPPLSPPRDENYRMDYHGWYIHRLQWNNQ